MTTAAIARLDVVHAPLPERYEAAKAALAECQRVDECKDWADKAQALASYARQADDDELHKTAIRIQSRAIRRCGELLKEYQAPGARTDKPSNGDGTRSQRQAAEQAGMSKRQEVTARRLASSPEKDFEAAVESNNPPTITSLSRPPRPGFEKATHLLGTIGRFVEFCEEHKPEDVACGLNEEELPLIRERTVLLGSWLKQLIVCLDGWEE